MLRWIDHTSYILVSIATSPMKTRGTYFITYGKEANISIAKRE